MSEKRQHVSLHSMSSLTMSYEIKVIVDKLNEEICSLKESKNSIIKSLENNLQLLNSEVAQLKHQVFSKDMAINSLTDENRKLILKIEDQKNEFEMYRKEMSELLKSKILENTQLEEHYKTAIEKSPKEEMNLQEVGEKRQQKYKDIDKKITRSLSKVEKCAQMLSELKQQVINISQNHK